VEGNKHSGKCKQTLKRDEIFPRMLWYRDNVLKGCWILCLSKLFYATFFGFMFTKSCGGTCHRMNWLSSWRLTLWAKLLLCQNHIYKKQKAVPSPREGFFQL